MAYLPAKRKTTPSGWTSFNAPCCVHNGTGADTRGRGGVISEGDTVSYHCFNCGYKASWQPGRNLSNKMKKLLQWLNAPDNVISKLSLAVLNEHADEDNQKLKLDLPEFSTIPLPKNSIQLKNQNTYNDKHSLSVLEYMAKRNLNLDDTNYYWSSDLAFRERFVIPFYYEKRIVGYTARTVSNNRVKYLTDSQPGFVFNLDEQNTNKAFCIVCEGPIDAIHVDGCALLGSEINDQQAMLLNKLDKDIFVVPDRDNPGKKLVEQAIERGWGVSMPDWDKEINDIGDAVTKYGRLYTLYSISNSAENSPLKIRLRAKKWFT
tara:strand:+ start:7277 stop:8233 length:957 start_codon:yes stop_codon:yes gene_type:complete